MSLVQKEIQVVVFELNNNIFNQAGDIDNYTAVSFGTKFIGCHDFELWAPLTDNNVELLKVGNVVWVGGTRAALIEIVTETTDDVLTKKLDVKGRTLEVLLKSRVLWGRKNFYNMYISTIMYSLVNECCINPTIVARKVPFLQNAIDTSLGSRVIMQQTGQELYEILEDLAYGYGVGFYIDFDGINKTLTFRAAVGTNYSINQNVNAPIVLSGEMEDVLSSEYYINIQNEKGVALVAGEGDGADRVYVIAGDNTLSGYNRKELWVDARDLQSSEYDDTTGETTELTDEEYEELLQQRGNEKLGDCKVVQTYTAKVRPEGGMFTFGIDYNVGDTITIQDKQLNITVDAQIMGAVEEFTDVYELTLEIGFGMPTLLRRILSRIG